MVTRVRWLLCVSWLGACAPAPCDVERDVGPTDVPDVPACRSRIVLGPVVIGGPLHGFGLPCAEVSVARSERYPVTIHVFAEDGSVRAVEGECNPGSDYMDMGYWPPGRYLLAIEGRDGADIHVGRDLLTPGACDPFTTGETCFPLEVQLADCELRVIPTWFPCGPTGCGVAL